MQKYNVACCDMGMKYGLSHIKEITHAEGVGRERYSYAGEKN
jgi:hypothetical protein